MCRLYSWYTHVDVVICVRMHVRVRFVCGAGLLLIWLRQMCGMQWRLKVSVIVCDSFVLQFISIKVQHS